MKMCSESRVRKWVQNHQQVLDLGYASQTSWTRNSIWVRSPRILWPEVPELRALGFHGIWSSESEDPKGSSFEDSLVLYQW
uniref:Uncharacterized protein n=1 Tax=Acrobeloides nanus TaxID=290746 RepID=A0A914DDI7_9BILA